MLFLQNLVKAHGIFWMLLIMLYNLLQPWGDNLRIFKTLSSLFPFPVLGLSDGGYLTANFSTNRFIAKCRLWRRLDLKSRNVLTMKVLFRYIILSENGYFKREYDFNTFLPISTFFQMFKCHIVHSIVIFSVFASSSFNRKLYAISNISHSV